MALGFSRLVCMEVLCSQYPRLVTPIRLMGPPGGDAAAACPEMAAARKRKREEAGTARHPRRCGRSTRVQLDDQRFLDVGAELVAVGRLLEDAFELGAVDLDPVGQALTLGELHRVGDAQLLLRLLADRDGV